MQVLRKYAFLSVICIIVVCCLTVGLWMNHWLHQSLPITEPTTLLIPKGTGVRSLIGQMNREDLWNGEPWQLLIYDRATGASPIKAGEYQLTPEMTIAEFLSDVRGGNVYLRKVTFPEGWTVQQWVSRLAKMTGVKSTAITMSPEALSQQVRGSNTALEGWLFPDTYTYSYGARDVEILQRAYRAMLETLEKVSPQQSGAAFDDQSLLILASMVEKESGQANDRRKIARVFLNRLDKGMRLQSDPTVIYGLGSNFDGDLTRRHLRTDNPFNTYTRFGLPPTAIANPGLDAIRAVLSPLPGDWLYFVGRGDGSSQFSLDLKSHQQAVNRYQLGIIQ